MAGVVGGPLGRHAGTRSAARWSTPLRILVILTLITSFGGWLQKAPCRNADWRNEYQFSRLCYSDVVALYGAEGLNEGAIPYVDHPVEYPPLIGAIMYGTQQLMRPFGSTSYASFYDLTALVLGLFALAAVLLTSRLSGRRPWDAAMVALAPTLLLHLTTNWDTPVLALSLAALLAWARRKPVLAGVLLGLATATKLYPVLFLLPLLLLCLRAGQLRAWLRTALATAGAIVLCWGPVVLFAGTYTSNDAGELVTRPGGWAVGLARLGIGTATVPDGRNAAWRFWELNETRPADWDSLWFVAQRTFGSAGAVTIPTLNVLTALMFVGLFVGVAWLCLAAPRRPRLAAVLFLTLAAFLLSNKVFSPQYTLWLLPLAVLARPRWPAFLFWQASEALLLLLRFSHFIYNDRVANGENPKGLEVQWFFTGVLIRDCALLLVCALVIRDILRPEGDVVRYPLGSDAQVQDDPAGGVLDGARDRWSPFWRRRRPQPEPVPTPEPADAVGGEGQRW